ncbi:hypothetical protein [Paracoccus beibuensis]|uniref:hypothetical protein n=1 Tax=Paracoccus beibuensis TaxID=547602 RepID=UPI00223E9EEB|nr:hypothetical protein [Paracoccus beibuensis]
MKRHLGPLILALSLGAAPAVAQDEPGFFERGITGFMQQFFEDTGPEGGQIARDLATALDQMGPVLRDMAALVDDISNYHAPERLENGDILIRRREGAPPPPDLGEDEPAPDSGAGVPVDPDSPQIAL